MLDWSALFSALALVFVIEGLLLLVGPESMKRMYAEAATLEHKVLRLIGRQCGKALAA